MMGRANSVGEVTPGAGAPDTFDVIAVESLCHRLFDASPDCVKLLDAEGRVLWINAPGCVLMDIADPSQFVGSPWVTFWDGEVRSAAEGAVQTARTGEIGRFNGPCRTAAGRPKYWDVIVLGLPRPVGEARLLVVSRDVSELVSLLERERMSAAAERAARQEASRALAQRDEIMTSVSHQIRTPLNTILACSVLLQADGNAATRATAREIQSLASAQVALVDRLIATQSERVESVFEALSSPQATPPTESLPPSAVIGPGGGAGMRSVVDLAGIKVVLALADGQVDAALAQALRAYGADADGAGDAGDAWPFHGAVIDVEQGRALAWLAECRARHGREAFWCVAVTSDRSTVAETNLRANGFTEVLTRPLIARDLALRVNRAQAAINEARRT